jgi:predicted Ser/Thr protein kinase
MEVLELLGRGGMGAVYKARQKELDRLVALKVLPPEVSRDPAFAERFTREARALARLSHPNIVVVYDFGRTPHLPSPSGRGAGGEGAPPSSVRADGAGGEGTQTDGPLFYFIMEYVDGVNLRQAIQSGGIAPKEALAIVPQICDALQFAHDEGIVHRDIKPENILLDKRGRVKIADFGLAKLLGHAPGDVSLTGTQQVMGTLRYMAPEQMEGTKAVDHRADIYSLGVVFYELLTGELPIGRFAPPSKKVQIDVRLDEVVLRALEKEPEKRYQHASDVKTEIQAISSAAPLVSQAPAAAVPDAVLRRRVTVITLVGITLAEFAFLGLQAGYLAGADWYFKRELPYDWLSSFFKTTAAINGAFLAWWWYLLAKAPNTPRSFADFFRTMRGPDPRVKRLWLPLGIFLGTWLAGMAVSMAALGDSDTAQTIVESIPFVLGPYLLMAVLWWVYRPRDQRVGRAPPPSPFSVTPGGGITQAEVERARAQVTGPAIGLLITGVLHCAVLVLLIGVFVLLWRPSGHGPPDPTPRPSEPERMEGGRTDAPSKSMLVEEPLEEPSSGAAKLAVPDKGDVLYPPAVRAPMAPATGVEIWLLLLTGLVFLVGLLPGVAMIVGAVKMMRLRSYPWAITASVLALLPCTPAGLLGLIMGVWSLVVLSRPEVKAAFAALAGGAQPAGRVAVGPRPRSWLGCLVLLLVLLLLLPLALLLGVLLMRYMWPSHADVRRPSDQPVISRTTAAADCAGPNAAVTAPPDGRNNFYPPHKRWPDLRRFADIGWVPLLSEFGVFRTMLHTVFLYGTLLSAGEP